MTTRDEQRRGAHFALLPFLAQGHLIPMADIGRLLAKHGVKVTIFTTPVNASRIEPVISRASASGLSIDVVHLRFPGPEIGLREGVENMDMVRTLEDAAKFFKVSSTMKEELTTLLRGLEPAPSCLVADMCFPWARDVARGLGVPRIAFHGTSCFSLTCWHLFAVRKDFEEIASDTEYFVLPDFPDKIEMTKAQLRGTLSPMSPEWLELRDEALRADREAFGALINGFRELEPEYAAEYQRLTGKRLWCVGPVSLCNEDELDKAERGNRPVLDGPECSRWLDSKEPGSVLYACLGSLSPSSASQLIEIGLALENSGNPFIWVVRDPSDEFERWVGENGFEEKVKERGLVVRGWAPQVLILSHPSVGGFFTHCGWNSTVEGISYGVPMLTWPVLGEQFCNERFVVDVLRTGVRGGVEVPVTFGDAERVGVQVRSGEILRAVEILMDKGREGEERSERARKLAAEAKRAVGDGGSSYNDLNLFVEDVMKYRYEREKGSVDIIS